MILQNMKKNPTSMNIQFQVPLLKTFTLNYNIDWNCIRVFDLEILKIVHCVWIEMSRRKRRTRAWKNKQTRAAR